MNDVLAFLTTAAASSLAAVFGWRIVCLQYKHHPPGFVVMQTVCGVYSLLVGLAVQDHGWDAADMVGCVAVGMYAWRSRERVHQVLNPPAQRVMDFVPDTRIVPRNSGSVDDASAAGIDKL